MRTHTGDWHVIYAEEPDHPDDWDPIVLHPNSCGLTFTEGFGVDRICGVRHEIDNNGFDDLLPNHEIGWFRVRDWVEQIPGNPNWGSGFTELDAGVEVEGLDVRTP